MNPAIDPCVVSSREKLKYLDQFNALNPVNGQVRFIFRALLFLGRIPWVSELLTGLSSPQVTGAQARDFFLQSQLPPLVLGQIW